MNCLRSLTMRFGAVFLFAVSLAAFSGCERKEKVLDIETPRGEIEVERDPETGDTDVEVSRDPKPNE